jgi:hypothetical protein
VVTPAARRSTGRRDHGVIRTGHAVRALRELDNQVRRAELAHALAYWASRWQPVPDSSSGAVGKKAQALPPGPALDAIPSLDADPDSGIRDRVTQLAATAGWRPALHAVAHEADHARFVDQVTTEALRRANDREEVAQPALIAS